MTFPTQFVSQNIVVGPTAITHPIYTFTINLARMNSEAIGPITNQRNVTVLAPDMYQNSPDLGRSMAAQHSAYTTSWLPGFLRGENIVLNSNGTITAYGQKAVYLKKNYADIPNPWLTLTDAPPYDLQEFEAFENAVIGSGGAKGGGSGIFAKNGVQFT